MQDIFPPAGRAHTGQGLYRGNREHTDGAVVNDHNELQLVMFFLIFFYISEDVEICPITPLIFPVLLQ